MGLNILVSVEGRSVKESNHSLQLNTSLFFRKGGSLDEVGAGGWRACFGCWLVFAGHRRDYMIMFDAERGGNAAFSVTVQCNGLGRFRFWSWSWESSLAAGVG